jgi:predicted alpha/beta-fold hydrolase
VPTRLLQAKDDSLIPFEAFSDPAIQANPHISLAATDHGGHVAFLARGSNRFWIDQAVLEWIEWQIAQQQTCPYSLNSS